MRVFQISLTVLGIFVALIGLVWMGQGSGYFPYPSSSFMIDQSRWIWRGALAAIVGLAIIFASRRLVR